MRRHGRGRGRRGAHRAEPTGSGPLATVGHVLGSTVPKRVSPPRPLRVAVVSGAIVGALLFSYSTTQIYLRFTEPDQTPPAPSVTTSAAPPTDGHGSPQAAISTQVEITVGAEESSAPSPSQDAPDGTERTAPVPDPGETASPGGHQSFPVPQSAPGTPRVSYQKIAYDETHFMGHVTITNASDAVVENWELRVKFSDARIVSAWGTEWEPVPGGFIARQPHWSNGIPPGQSITISFTARGTSHTPESCSFNGVPCSL